MKVHELISYDGPDGLRPGERATPDLLPGHVIIEVAAIGINYPDLLMTQGRYQLRPELPVVPGCEVAGTVIAADAESDVQVGDRVAAFVWSGGFAERVLVPTSHLMKIPDDIGFEHAAAMVMNYHTVLFALDRRAGLRSGESVLVLGAGGGIGTAALQVASALGATVLAGVAGDQDAATAERALPGVGAIKLDQGFAAAVRAATEGRGVDVVLDPLGDWIFGECLRALAPGGRAIVVGFAAGDVPTVATNRLLLKNIGVVGAAFGAALEHDDQLMGQQSAVLERLVLSGHVRPAIGTTAGFDEIPHHLGRLSRGEVRGKAVVTLDNPRKETGS